MGWAAPSGLKARLGGRVLTETPLFWSRWSRCDTWAVLISSIPKSPTHQSLCGNHTRNYQKSALVESENWRKSATLVPPFQSLIVFDSSRNPLKSLNMSSCWTSINYIITYSNYDHPQVWQYKQKTYMKKHLHTILHPHCWIMFCFQSPTTELPSLRHRPGTVPFGPLLCSQDLAGDILHRRLRGRAQALSVAFRLGIEEERGRWGRGGAAFQPCKGCFGWGRGLELANISILISN